MNELALFAGVGGGLLATKWLLGWRTVCYVENNPYRVEVLKARIGDGLLDDAPIWDDAQTFDGRPWAGSVDIITAGFPCQPFSQAGKRRGADDKRNMWPDTIRIIREIRPQYALLENVAGLLTSGYFGTILGDLAKSRYDARWRLLSAAEVGAPHKRDRVWIVANAQGILGDVSTPDRIWGANGNEQSGQFGGQDFGVLPIGSDWGLHKPPICIKDDGMANRVERMAAIGDGQVPAVVKVVWQLLGMSS